LPVLIEDAVNNICCNRFLGSEIIAVQNSADGFRRLTAA
jgi:hypothetical protein